MVFLRDLDCKIYWETLAVGIPPVPCPNPSCQGCLLGPHGWYRRFLGGQLVAFRRTLCPRCGVTHALLPEDVCAYQDLTLPALERAMDAGRPTSAARAVGEATVATVRRARRWLRGSTWTHLMVRLPAAGTVMDRIVAIVGEAPGKLIRLRRRLWSKRSKPILLGGLNGLFLHGRPCRPCFEVST